MISRTLFNLAFVAKQSISGKGSSKTFVEVRLIHGSSCRAEEVDLPGKMVAFMWPAALMPNPCPEGAGLSISSRKRLCYRELMLASI